jgi:hypothetical protein
MSGRTCVEVVRVHRPLWFLDQCVSQFETADYLSEYPTGVGVLVVSAASRVQLKSPPSKWFVNEQLVFVGAPN